MRIRSRGRPRRSARQAILDAATTVLSDNPGAAMAKVAEAAGVGRATLYRHFPSREDLIKALSLEAIRLTDEACAPVFAGSVSAEEGLREMIEALIPFGDRYHFLASEAQASADPEVAAATERQLDGLAAWVEQAKQEGLVAADAPTAWVVAVIDSLIWTAWSVVQGGDLTARDAAYWAARTLVDGVR